MVKFLVDKDDKKKRWKDKKLDKNKKYRKIKDDSNPDEAIKIFFRGPFWCTTFWM